MRSISLLATLLCIFGTFVAAWTKEDHEIFRIRDEVIAHNGPNVTFYDLLGIKPSASQSEITKANRKKSVELHPDKARRRFEASFALKKNKSGKKKPGVNVNRKPTKKEIDTFMKEANAAYQRLSVIVDILKGPSRERYDHFLKNGFPKWKGTGYYYSRFRPGLGSVMIGLLVVGGGGMHYFALVMSWKRRREFVERYIRHARRTAWGDDTGIQGLTGLTNGTPEPAQGWGNDSTPEPEMAPVNRRQKRLAEKEARKDKKSSAAKKARSSGISTPVEAAITSGPQGAKKRIVAENGKVLVVDSSGNVFLEEENDEGFTQEFLLDPNEEPKPTISDTLLFQLPKYLYHKSLGRYLSPATEPPELESEGLPEDEAALQAATAPNANGEARKRRNKAKNVR